MLFRKLRRRENPETLSALSIAATIGLHMASGVLVGAVLGYLLDKWLETAPWCLIVFTFVGIIAGFKNVYVDTKRLLALQYPPTQAKKTVSGANAPGSAEQKGNKDAPSGPKPR